MNLRSGAPKFAPSRCGVLLPKEETDARSWAPAHRHGHPHQSFEEALHILHRARPLQQRQHHPKMNQSRNQAAAQPILPLLLRLRQRRPGQNRLHLPHRSDPLQPANPPAAWLEPFGTNAHIRGGPGAKAVAMTPPDPTPRRRANSLSQGSTDAFGAIFPRAIRASERRDKTRWRS
jgi:hypothetical protein